MKFPLFKKRGGRGKKNGDLLALASTIYQVFITVDRNLYFQQNVPKAHVAILILVARTNRLADLKPLASKVLAELPELKPGDVCWVPKHQT